MSAHSFSMCVYARTRMCVRSVMPQPHMLHATLQHSTNSPVSTNTTPTPPMRKELKVGWWKHDVLLTAALNWSHSSLFSGQSSTQQRRSGGWRAWLWSHRRGRDSHGSAALSSWEMSEVRMPKKSTGFNYWWDVNESERRCDCIAAKPLRTNRGIDPDFSQTPNCVITAACDTPELLKVLGVKSGLIFHLYIDISLTHSSLIHAGYTHSTIEAINSSSTLETVTIYKHSKYTYIHI